MVCLKVQTRSKCLVSLSRAICFVNDRYTGSKVVSLLLYFKFWKVINSILSLVFVFTTVCMTTKTFSS